MRQSLACVLLVCVLLRVASTPSAITVASGDHVVSIKKSGFEEWNRKVTVSPRTHQSECRIGSRIQITCITRDVYSAGAILGRILARVRRFRSKKRRMIGAGPDHPLPSG